jgi:hypothetical protein
MISIGFGLGCIGFILLSLSLKRHFQQVFPASRSYTQWKLFNRVAGYTLVLCSAIPCILLRGWWIGMVLWISIWAAAAFLQALLLTYRPQASLMFAAGGILLCVYGIFQ